MHFMNSASRGQIVPFVFGQDALAASQTDVQLPTAIGEGSQAVDGYTMPFDYDIIAVTATTDTTVTAGSLSVGATVNGTENANTTLTMTTGTDKALKVQRGKASGVAGSRLGCEITTNSGFLPVTADLVAVVYVLFRVDGV